MKVLNNVTVKQIFKNVGLTKLEDGTILTSDELIKAYKPMQKMKNVLMHEIPKRMMPSSLLYEESEVELKELQKEKCVLKILKSIMTLSGQPFTIDRIYSTQNKNVYVITPV